MNASESLQATIKISGKGNLKLFSPPSIEAPSSLEKYDPEYTENVSTNLAGMNGNISNTYTLVPQFQGKYPISSVDFTFFNTSLKKYETLKTKEIIVNVLEGPTLLTEKVDTQNSTTPSTSVGDMSILLAIDAVPALPGAQYSWSTITESLRAKHNECSLPPPPTTNTL